MGDTPTIGQLRVAFVPLFWYTIVGTVDGAVCMRVCVVCVCVCVCVCIHTSYERECNRIKD